MPDSVEGYDQSQTNSPRMLRLLKLFGDLQLSRDATDITTLLEGCRSWDEPDAMWRGGES